MNFRSIGLGLLLTAVSATAMAQINQPQNGGQNSAGGQAPYGVQPPPYRAQPTPRPYVPPATPLPVAPMNPEPKAEGVPMRFVDPPGYGWCRYTDDVGKQTFYTAPFPGAPKHDVTPRDIAYADYIHRAFPSAGGAVDCYWRPFDSAYDSQVNEEQAESADQLRNYKMTNTQWKPAPT
ncbi:MAG TPA: hypothetical protein VGI79_13625 [Caulobacteraceae bacterium]|jgi:hypothetical protein